MKIESELNAYMVEAVRKSIWRKEFGFHVHPVGELHAYLLNLVYLSSKISGKGVRWGLAPGSLVLIGGDPGVGKSTLLLQVGTMLVEGCELIGQAPMLYVSVYLKQAAGNARSITQARDKVRRCSGTSCFRAYYGCGSVHEGRAFVISSSIESGENLFLSTDEAVFSVDFIKRGQYTLHVYHGSNSTVAIIVVGNDISQEAVFTLEEYPAKELNRVTRVLELQVRLATFMVVKIPNRAAGVTYVTVTQKSGRDNCERGNREERIGDGEREEEDLKEGAHPDQHRGAPKRTQATPSAPAGAPDPAPAHRVRGPDWQGSRTQAPLNSPLVPKPYQHYGVVGVGTNLDLTRDYMAYNDADLDIDDDSTPPISLQASNM
eukprot:Gb_05974 [translate_table: standard]